MCIPGNMIKTARWYAGTKARSVDRGGEHSAGPEYVRNGTGEIVMFVAPLEGWRRTEITERITKKTGLIK
jgi:hypothetical protein